MAPKPKPKKLVAKIDIEPSRIIKKMSKTPVYNGAQAREAASGGPYKDPKTKRIKLFQKQYKA